MIPTEKAVDDAAGTTYQAALVGRLRRLALTMRLVIAREEAADQLADTATTAGMGRA